MTIAAPSVRAARALTPSWFESLLFVALMSGPPKFRARDPFASLAGSIDLVVGIHLAVWACGGLWVLARLYQAALRARDVPFVSPTQAVGALFIAALTLSLGDSPGILLTTFTLGQFAIMLGFVGLFTHRFGTTACLRHLFFGVTVLALATLAAAYLAPGLVTDETRGAAEISRLRGDYIADTGSVAVIGLVLCLSNVPPLSGPSFWAATSMFGMLLVASRTRSAYVAMFAFLAIGFVCGKRLRVRRLLVPLAIAALGMVVMDTFASTANYLVRDRESIQSMSDRIPLWQHLTSVVMREAPFTGMGYYAATRMVATEYNPGLGDAHSAFFEVLTGGGILGAALYLTLCGSLAWCATRLLWKASGQPGAVAASGLLAAALIIGVATPAALHAGPLGFAFWSSTALLPGLLRDAVRRRTATGPDPRQSRLAADPRGSLAALRR